MLPETQPSSAVRGNPPRIAAVGKSKVVVVLIPGLFGFKQFGDGEHALSYFDRVQEVLMRATGLPSECFVVHDPPPAGALSTRVASLCQRLERMLAKPGTAPDAFVLVGHSTGGLDARLLCNRRYLWPGGPSQRDALLGKIRHVVTLSSPMHGTPIAARLRGGLELAVPALFLLSILAKHGKVDRSAQLLLLYSSLTMALRGKPHNERLLDFLGHLDKTSATQVERFLEHIVDDHALIHDLTPHAMRDLNARIAHADTPHIDSFVTVSPAPGARAALAAARTFTTAQFMVYGAGYELTWPEKGVSSPFPSGPWFPSKTPRARLTGYGASDGVVPASSQTLHGVAAGIVEADHLDVVGHFTSKQYHGTTVFKSGAAFNDERFQALWSAVARSITPHLDQPSKRDVHREVIHVH